MYSYDEVRHVHVEPTTRCNAGCPMCARNARGKKAPGLELTELSIDDVRSILPAEFLERIAALDFCGAYGDPAAAPDLIDMVKHVRASSPSCSISVYTNGGIRPGHWWERLARTLGSPGRVIFAIDGLGDTNGVYRRGVDFAKVVENARAFIDCGAEARWEFLVFRHNEHQITEARELSRKMGFHQFSVKKSGRFLEPTYDFVPEFEDHDDLDRFPIFDDNGKVVGYLEPPRESTLVNETVRNYQDLLRRHGSLDALFSKTPIDCRVAKTRSVFVSAKGHVFPCCWTYVQATRPALYGYPTSADRQVVDLVEATGGFERIDAKKVGLRAAIESPLFAAIASSWSCSSVAEGRLRVCARACGKDFPAYFDQFTDSDLLPRGLQDR